MFRHNLLYLIALTTLLAIAPCSVWSQALFIGGGNSYVNIGDLDVAGNQITVEAMVMSVGGGVNIVSKHTGPGNVNYLLRPGGVEITTTNGYISAPANFTPAPNECYHVAFTYDGANLNYYVNGCLASTVPHSGNLVTNNLATAIGNQSSCQCEAWNGYIDEVRIWNVARTEAQLQANMADLPNPTTQGGLLAYYKFSGNYLNVQGNAAWNGVPVGTPQLLANPTCDNADFTFTSSATVTNVSCPGGNNGTVTLNSDGGFNNYFYSVDGINFTQTNFVGNLPAGNLNVLARSGIGSCIVPVPVNVTQPAPFDVNVTGTDPLCHGAANGTGTVTATGGTMPYSLLWTGGSTLYTPSNLAAGLNTVQITDVNNCTASGSITLGEPTEVLPSAFATFVSNAGVCDATGTATPSGGTPPYTYSWGNGSTNAVANNLCEGPSTITVTDANGCVGQQVVNVSVPACLTDVDFNTWQQAGAPGNGNWVILAGGAQLRQTVNGNPTFFLTPVDYINVRLKGRMRTTNGDDDFIGAVFGHKQPLGNSTTYDTWLFDWKQRAQGNGGFNASEGFALSRIVGNIPNTGAALNPTFWGHTNTPEFNVIATDYGAGKGYVTSQFHDIEILYTTTRAVILVDNDTVFDVPGCYEPGRFGFYNYSQPDVYYTDFTYALFTSFNLENERVCVGDTAKMIFYESCGNFNPLAQFDELQWDFGDGTTLVNNDINSNNANPSHVYSAPGSYTVRLIALDQLGCRDTVYRSVNILPLPQPNYTVANQCHQDQTQFTEASASSTPLTQWGWQFGDGTASALPDPIHAYAQPGTYDVTLTVTDSDGCMGTGVIPTLIHALPDPIIGSVGVCEGNPSEMEDFSQDVNGITSSSWDLGDGNTANTPFVSHTYAAAGTFNVTLTVVSGAGCVNQLTQPIPVFPNPVADFSFTPVCAGLATQLTDASAVAPPSSLTTWVWDIGNNGITDYQTTNAQHTFGLGGTYDVSLVVRTEQGCADSIVYPVIAHSIPVAQFDADDVCLNIPSDFVDGSTVNTANITIWDWNFGDGASSNVQNPSHTFNSVANHQVTLTVTSDVGCSASTQGLAVVLPLPQAAFDPIEDCYAVNYPFNDASTIASGSVTSWSWDFGDGATANTQNPSHTYATFGTYTVQLTVSSGFGCVGSTTQDIVLHDNPIAGFIVPPTCQQEPVQLQDTSSIQQGSIVAWAWTFGGGGSSILQNPIHSFSTSGNLNVTLSVTSDFGCTGTTTVTVPIFPKPMAAFTAPDVCLNEETVITDQSTVASGSIDVFDWNLGDGATETTPAFNHLYQPAGTYDITLMIETDQGCRDTLVVQTVVHQLPTADFTFADVCLETNATLTDQSVANSDQLASWQWDLGDGTMPTNQGPIIHSYYVEGDYDVTLIVGTNVGCSDTITQVITIHPMPVADFTADSVCLGLPTTFVNLSNVSAGAITSNTWLFGGGQGSEQTAPTFTFPNTGYTNVSLTVATALGCIDQVTKPVRIYVIPQTTFAAHDTCAGKQIAFTNQSTIAEGAISNYAWSMGDGNAYSTGSINHTYPNHGFYTVRLTATSNYGCVDSTSLIVEVYPLPIPSFAALPPEGCVPLPVQFYNTTTIPSGYSLATHSWRFGNGGMANVPNPTTLYTTEGGYNVTLVATSAKGCVDSLTISNAVTAWPKPVADFRTDTLVYHMRFPKPRITEMSQGATIWRWDFGDGTEYEEQVPQHAYQEHGTYDIIQTVFNEFGCSDTFGIRIVVQPSITFFIPNSFTPNDDGLNDTFFGTGENIQDYQMWIYNRWGQNIFYAKDKDRHWEGIYNGNPVESGMYLYKFIIVDILNRTKVFSGEVHLIR